MSGSESFTIDIPPPCAAGETPVAVLPLMMLFLIVGVPAAFIEIPPPLPEGQVLFAMTFPMTCANPAPPSARPPPPQPPEQPDHWVLFCIVFPWIVGDPESAAIPPPATQAVLFWITNPFNRALGPSPLLKSTTGALPPPSIIVTEAPAELVTVIALPRKLMF